MLSVIAHHNYKDRVILIFNEFTITVMADDLRRAITNACNHD